MLAEERFEEILKLVEERRTITVQELTEILETSESTIRRDLTLLHSRGALNKVHGGATALEISYNTRDDNVEIRQDLNREEKIKIARYAATLIKPNDFVYIDAGTTTELLIDYITEKNAVFVTNATVHAKKLAQKGCTTYILGGELKLSTEAVVGNETIESLQKYNFTKGFWGTNGVNVQSGFSTPDVNEAMVKKVSMERTKEKYVLCDASKFSQISSVTFSAFANAVIITSEITDSFYKSFKNIKEVGV